jgi:hypothetical protein
MIYLFPTPNPKFITMKKLSFSVFASRCISNLAQTIKRLTALTLVSLFFALSSHGQVSFMHAVGAGSYFSGLAAAPGIMYAPRLNVISFSDELSLSVASNIALGFALSSREGLRAFAFSVPVHILFNGGHAATPDSDATFGGFAGAGFAFTSIGSTSAFGADYSRSIGPSVTGGVRFYFRTTASIDLRVSYVIGVVKKGPNTFAIGALYTFGDFF